MLTASQGFLLEDCKQNQQQYKERENKHPEQKVIHKWLIVEDPAGEENEQDMHDGLHSERENAIYAESKLIDVTGLIEWMGAI
jgi:hypothetical protein